MQFFLYEILARIVAIYLCFDCSRTLWRGILERKIEYLRSADFLDWLLDWSNWNWVAHRDATPVRYWIQVGLHATALVGCIVVAIFGWWHPDA
jgi:hypothetical protein